MICKFCMEATAQGHQGKEAHEELGCKGGTHCDCQHRDGPRENWIQTKPVFPVG